MSQESWFWKEDGCKKDCSTLDGRMPQRRGNVEAQAISLPKLSRSQTSDPTSFKTVGRKSEDVKERMGVEERH